MAWSPRSGRRALAAAAVALAPALQAAPAHAQVCLDCFTEVLGANPFTTPLVLPSQFLWNATLGLAGPVEDPSWLPNLQGKYGLVDGLELAGTLGYEPSLGLRARVGQAGDVVFLGAARAGWAYFRGEWLGALAAPVLWTPGAGWLVRVEPQLTLNQVTGHHAAVDLAVSRQVLPGTALALTLSPDYRVAEQLWTGAATLAVTRSIGASWAVYGLGSAYLVDGFTPLVAVGVTHVPAPRE